MSGCGDNDASLIEPIADDMHDKRGVEPSRNVWQAIGKGLRSRCPACGEGRIFRAYLKVNNICPHCGEELFHHRADDAPPYLTILICKSFNLI